ncbi:hypothetical protein GCM10009785_01360 [Brooklawnia cerclae]|uniref:Uncharacterized protein n=2 Tax=Brooklawnia cerclae TaxID=349934 RepID=A0ABX0SCZ0_9ACTN|nr:hypothetical protein [Brooklawnia cerclae]
MSMKLSPSARAKEAAFFPGFVGLRPLERDERGEPEWLKSKGLKRRENVGLLVGNQEAVWLVTDAGIRAAVIDVDTREIVRWVTPATCGNCGANETAHQRANLPSGRRPACTDFKEGQPSEEKAS